MKFVADNTMNKFNLRVYGILINKNNEVLLSSELRFEKPMIKFPGGGLEFGEGLVDCLKREFQEECGIEGAQRQARVRSARPEGWHGRRRGACPL